MTVIPSKRHRPVGQETGQTNPIERLNNTFRQRISRLVRESLSFYKKWRITLGEPFGILSITTTKSPLPAGSAPNPLRQFLYS
jgi:insertion element IS1 protein InsB